jgi:hypothetical protein
MGLFEPNQVPQYHTVCPLYTYLLALECYSEPINKLVITVIPVYANNTLKWTFSTLYTSSISQSVIPQLVQLWTADDSVLQSLFVI